MFRYLAIVWDPACPEQAAVEKSVRERFEENVIQANPAFAWSHVYESPGLRVFCTQPASSVETCHLLSEKRGVVLGNVFDGFDVDAAAGGSITVPRPAKLSARSTQIAATQGRWLAEECWGEYVAFIHRAQDSKTWVLRAPCSGLPCLRTSYRGLQMFYSRLGDVFALNLIRFTINWAYIEASLLSLGESIVTGLSEVSVVRSGSCLEIQGEKTLCRCYWDAGEVASRDNFENEKCAEEVLRGTVKACVHAWASCFESVLMKLSGGFDSSVVLGCLADAPSKPNVIGINYYSPDVIGDERSYARAAADRANCELVEISWNADFDLESILGMPPIHLPWAGIDVAQTREDEINLGSKYKASAVFNGTDGDSLFFRADMRLSVADYLYRNGVRPHLFSTAYHAARHDQYSIWNVLGHSIRWGLLDQWDLGKTLAEDNQLVTDKALNAAMAADSHAQWQRPAGREAGGFRLPPGKRWHALTLSSTLDSTTLIDTPESPDPISPLRAKPVIEAALRIPTYVLNVGRGDLGDRALARRAFAKDLPKEILQRRSKGGPTGNVITVLRRNGDFVRDLLLNGQLVTRGLLQRDVVEAAVADMPSGPQKGIVPINDYMLIEAWLHCWGQYDRQCPATI